MTLYKKLDTRCHCSSSFWLEVSREKNDWLECVKIPFLNPLKLNIWARFKLFEGEEDMNYHFWSFALSRKKIKSL